MKILRRTPGWCRSHPARITIIVVTVEIIIAFIFWIVGDLSEDYTNISSYILFWVIVLFASIAAVSSILASMSAQESLQLTRASQRPFLNVMLTLARDFNRDRAYLYAEIENTGDFPADGAAVKCEWYIQSNGINETQQLREEKEVPSTIFPGVKTGPTFLVEEAQVDKIGAPDSRVRVSVSYSNKLTHGLHETRRTFRFVYAVGHTTFHQIQAVPIAKEDYWT